MFERELQLQALTDRWMAAVCRHDIDAVVDFYAPSGILVGTVAQRIKHGKDDIRLYFAKFLAKDGLCGQFDNPAWVQRYPNWGIHTGTYTFKWQENGQGVVVPARYTFVWIMTPNGWRITNHHSSVLPE